MKAMVLEQCGNIASQPLQLQELEPPELRSREVLVRVEACGVCRTDLHLVEG